MGAVRGQIRWVGGSWGPDRGSKGQMRVKAFGARWWGLGYWGGVTGDRGTGVRMGVGCQT